MRKTRKCVFCGREFTVNSGMQKYCREKCAAEARRARKKRMQDFMNAVEPLAELCRQEYFTFSKAAVLMGCTRQYIYKLVAQGKLKVSRIGGRMSLVRKADIEVMLEASPYYRVLPFTRPKAVDDGKAKAKKKNTKWEHVYKHFHRFTDGKCTFGEIDVELCNRFKEYLLTAPQFLHTRRKLHVNSVSGYWSTFRAVLHTAYRERKIRENPNGFLECIDTMPTEKEHLSQEELIRLADTPCDAPALKNACLFACLTGLRKSDVKALTWENIQPYGDGRMYVTVRMQKMKDLVNNPISDEALELAGPRGTGRVFPSFTDSMTQAPLKKWLKAAGITKRISFHSSRHTYTHLKNEAVNHCYSVYLTTYYFPCNTTVT